MTSIRKPNVAGQFYPEEAKTLIAMINKFLQDANVEHTEQPKAIIVPHAGYVYSGPIAANAYAGLQKFKNIITKVVLLGPAHRMYFSGIAATNVDFFETPLGRVPVSHDFKNILSSPEVSINEAAYDGEHSLEVQLPFLQVVLGEFYFIPLLIGNVHFSIVAKVLEQLWGDKETLVVVSSDLCHYLPYEVAKKIDALTSKAIINLAPEKINSGDACGRVPVQGLLQVVQQHQLTAKILDVRNSGDTLGSKDSVVGYGAYYFV